MADLLSYGEYRPDVSDLGQQLSQSIANVMPRADGYGPFPGLAAFSQQLGEACRGYFTARKVTDNTVVIFAATATRLYMMDNTTLAWSDVSKSGSAYTTLNVDAHWTFTQFNNVVIACQANAAPQKFNVTTDSAFSDVSGSPPHAAYCTTVNRFVVLSGLTSNPNRVQWSGLNDITNWTSGSGSSDYQDLPDGGIVRGVVGGELGVIVQDAALRSMSFSPGSDVIFNINKIAKDVGCIAPYTITQAGNRIFFLSALGWVMTDTSGAINYIGAEKIDRTFLTGYDSGQPQLVMAASDPQANVLYVAYKSNSSSATYADRGLVFNWLLNRWAPYTCAIEYLANAVKPGLTLEGLDSIAPGYAAVTGAANNGSGLIRLAVDSTSGWTTGDSKTVSGVGGVSAANGTWTITVINSTHIDLQGSSFSGTYTSGGIVGGELDEMETPFDALSSTVQPAIAAFNSSHQLSFFNGDHLEATLETAEQDGKGQRILVKGFRPITDATDVYGSISYRENLNATRSYTSEVAMNAYGYCAQMRSTRYARAKVRIPSGTNWSFISGVQPDAQGDGYA